MINLRVEVTGGENITRNLALARERIGRKIEKGLLAVGEELLKQSKPFVPKDTLALEDSGRVSQIGTLLSTLVVVGYGGKDFPPRTEFSVKENKVVTRKPHEYAVYVHEDRTVIHDVGKADYLREPLLTRHEEMRDAFRKGVGRIT